MLALYALLLVVGSLYPFTGWRPPSAWSADFLFADWPRYVTRTDLATNLLYVGARDEPEFRPLPLAHR